MAERRTAYEIYWEILVYCRTPRAFTAIIGRCDLNSKTGQEYLGFLVGRGFLSVTRDGERSTYLATDRAAEYTALFTRLYQGLFDKGPVFRV
jgi:predicted transcriptional regulator